MAGFRFTRVLNSAMLALALLTISAAAQGASVSGTAALDGASNVPPQDTPATGNFSVVINDLRGRFTLQVSNVVNLTEVHLHQGDAQTADGAKILILIPLLPFPLTIDGSITTEGYFNSTALTGPLAGDDLIALANDINKGMVYINAHSGPAESEGSAVIRGQLEVGDISF